MGPEDPSAKNWGVWEGEMPSSYLRLGRGPLRHPKVVQNVQNVPQEFGLCVGAAEPPIPTPITTWYHEQVSLPLGFLLHCSKLPR